MPNLICGDCLDKLKELPDNSVDAVVTDPPYGLSFMGKKWDYAVPSEAIWRECLRVLKPGGHLLAFAGTRTQHRMAVRIEDAGFEIRDMIAWIYGSGFPKSLDVSKAIDGIIGKQSTGFNCVGGGGRTNGGDKFRSDHPDFVPYQPTTEAAKQWNGWGTALKPALEPITVARKPLSEKTVAANVLKWGTGAININGGRISIEPCDDIYAKNPHTQNTGSKKSVNITLGGGSVYNIPPGRFPANLIHDGSDEVMELFPETKSGTRNSGMRLGMGYHGGNGGEAGQFAGDSGSAARFFYCAKASKKDRGEGNTHCTVKPTDLMHYLVRLVTPSGGVVLDPFMGSGSTGKAARLEGFDFIGIEKDPDYFEIAKARIAAAKHE